jgi:hypothetical protein
MTEEELLVNCDGTVDVEGMVEFRGPVRSPQTRHLRRPSRVG